MKHIRYVYKIIQNSIVSVFWTIHARIENLLMFANSIHTLCSYVSDSIRCLCLHLRLPFGTCTFTRLDIFLPSSSALSFGSFRLVLLSSLPFSLVCLPKFIHLSLCMVVHFAIYSMLCSLYIYKIHTVRYLSWEIVCECKIRYPIIRKWFFEWKSTKIWQWVSCKSAHSRWERAGVFVRLCMRIKGR